MLFGGGLTRIWDEFMELAGSSRPYREKLNAILDAVKRLTGTEACYLYFLDATGRRFMLEHIVVAEPERERVVETEEALGVPVGTEDVRSVLGAPPLSLVRSPADEEARAVDVLLDATETGGPIKGVDPDGALPQRRARQG